ncbi:MAG TPA: 16S rRNA (cytosine(1402)-N(4))-methyltransferase RsmH [Plasticicumulans sp.]|uniref:16S rRNA (cytosine(1402)-N(4))-methyltransferase RsmH n=1 Tax=Plasticicumulans sp. TaxID=2307179 RepID=UPI002C0EDCA4|nr:16S rRNA (cytosine(1402)-N(4))-methyltransferase RsmH [Plasticicumulans sp.]HMW28095.1 16S rRNA (cytosine(1402)-N(4))-methyltransferase RsmH [Plasticicumulans sp.]HMW42332.1 16S rRNA (cytosine(1402)-N(4))-methyltransferase RsmH [Plasticicumulans sp.]HND98035.1 16S rRNA (cytosine(1402)-N(4))-methyltransferase RsmH [Plasticicumulans sp.]HNE00138.1 16S rRNA (cytosine(1402)-N(4))-methyltransferase RsmH [Plasticicumulans sp.]HNF64798.1 16S rRNA (cytosine(1402)-N(4))-methyltransferase RsmH [Plast
MTSTLLHQSVLLHEAVDALNVRARGCYLDATFGRGGHARAVLARLGADGCLLALDRDPEAAAEARALAAIDPRLQFVAGPFSGLAAAVRAHGLEGRLDGILFDLGVSSPQLDDARRGFSFQQDGPLDMRMDPAGGPSAAEWLAAAGEAEISLVLRDLGEERFHRRIARRVVETRAETPIASTAQLAGLVAAAVPTRERGKHPATRAFQAIRIHVNRELDELQDALAQAVGLLAPGGRLAVISFHSLEDRIVKRFLRAGARGQELPPGLPVTGGPSGATLKLIGKAVQPSAAEIDANPRARSAVLRVAEKLP